MKTKTMYQKLKKILLLLLIASTAFKTLNAQITNVATITSSDIAGTNPVVCNGNLYYYGYNYTNSKFDLVKFNGTTLQTIPLLNANDNIGNYSSGAFDSDNSDYLYIANYNNMLYFNYFDASTNSYKLAKYDGLTINLINLPVNVNSTIYNFQVLNNKLYFFTFDENSGYTVLAQYDGNIIKIIRNANGIGNLSTQPQKFIEYNNEIYGVDATYGNSNGNLLKIVADSVKVFPKINNLDIGIGINQYGSGYLATFNNKLYSGYFSYQAGTQKYDCVQFDGTSLSKVTMPNNVDNFYSAINFNGTLVFNCAKKQALMVSYINMMDLHFH